ncbi:ABC transporter ATP-binding protein [Pseudoalteromonas phenolica]|uniref:ABC transporter ATP-binding protein n=1 Tax=Pseudoalteromonas phenolica TaxID=161398 RepID=A0A0S2K7I5_9GAMM|nr:ABC transporter ATP-binding protein [Pseudoalteromonas phenolica]ALO44185.1 ABC transporter, ATP-binding protein [Pseudoalteromonas phenolica]MBE0357177.1 putative ABC transport system ATP-binding protein [Pseudoalteromonas phenolica O-BC30]RXF03622.1 ABC transporter ATP-binding protein [Pseudoalteromonas phenolica O-BC30]TLX45333.1 ABC transporter ATP-binding protein [Pseudoalteromonas phenolica]TMO56382.1 ABC transporter ATP-binding protein [Pseudoalteromonas phenolica]
MSNNKIKLTNITKKFVTSEMETHALRGVDLEINEGDYVSISGPSGCGKSTLLSILGLLDTASDGEYMLAGHDVSNLSVNQRASMRNEHIGFVFQSFNLIDELSVFDNIALPLRYREKALSQEEVKQKVDACLAKVEMTHRAGHKPNQLSGGQQQRVAIARALVNDPAILLVDEPTGNLDSKNGDAVMMMLAELNRQGTTICMVTHDPRYADMAKRKLHLLDGVMADEFKMELAV